MEPVENRRVTPKLDEVVITNGHYPLRDGRRARLHDATCKNTVRVQTSKCLWVKEEGLAPRAAVMGSTRAKPDQPAYDLALDIAKHCTSNGISVTTGGGPGVMEAVSRGGRDGRLACKESTAVVNGVTLPLLPGERANPFLDRNYVAPFFIPRINAFTELNPVYLIHWGGIGSHLEAMYFFKVIADCHRWLEKPKELRGTPPLLNRGFSEAHFVPRIALHMPHYSYLRSFFAEALKAGTIRSHEAHFETYSNFEDATRFIDKSLDAWREAVAQAGIRLDKHGRDHQAALGHGHNAFKDVVQKNMRLWKKLHAFAYEQAPAFRVVLQGSQSIGIDRAEYSAMQDLARALTREGMDVVCGAGGGLLEAAALGAAMGIAEWHACHSDRLTPPRLIRVIPAHASHTTPRIHPEEKRLIIGDPLHGLQIFEALGAVHVCGTPGFDTAFRIAHTEQYLQFNRTVRREQPSIHLLNGHFGHFNFLPRVHVVGPGYNYIREQRNVFHSEGTARHDEFSVQHNDGYVAALNCVHRARESWRNAVHSKRHKPLN